LGIGAKMEVTVMTCLFTEWNMDVDAGQNDYFYPTKIRVNPFVTIEKIIAILYKYSTVA
jgi:hypothetical protein